MKKVKKYLYSLIVIFIFINVIAIIHSYKFTHFTTPDKVKTADPKQLSSVQKIKTAITGINNPRPVNKTIPPYEFETIKIKSNKEIECWKINAEEPRGTVILFHGYSANKSAMLDKAEIFLELNYNTFLVDFMGSGGSEGNNTTIGYFEADQVKATFDYVKDSGEEKIILFGTSMGAVAAMKAIHDYNLNPAALILECPFGTMYETVCSRFEAMNIPAVPMAGLLTFWGGVINGFNPFNHNPVDYATKINCPVLLMHGEKDERVSMEEINIIYKNLNGEKILKIYPLAGHENYLNKYHSEWKTDIEEFLNEYR